METCALFITPCAEQRNNVTHPSMPLKRRLGVELRWAFLTKWFLVRMFRAWTLTVTGAGQGAID